MARFTRRKFLQASGAGLAGILASHEAPVFAQQSQVHWIKWNDFVPASDELLRKSLLPEAMKALGIKINLETAAARHLGDSVGQRAGCLHAVQQPPAHLQLRRGRRI
jgi:multiple sugar transport system substrate-binding protein